MPTIFSVIDTTDGGDSGYEGFVKDAANWAVAETALSAATTHILVGGGAGVMPVFTASTGTGSPVRATSPTLVTPLLGTPTSGTLTNCTGLLVTGGGTGRATGTTAYALVATGTTATGAQQSLAAGATTEVLIGGGASALPVWTTATGSGAPVRATSPTLVTPLLGTPTSGVLTNCTGLPVAGGGTGASSASITAFNNITGYTASGATGTTSTNLVFSTSPTLVTPLLGTPTSGNLNNCTLTAPQPIGETTPNSIRGLNKEVFFTATDTADTAECAGTVVSNYGMTDADMTLTLPAAAEGLSFVFIIATARSKFIHVTAGAGDAIYLNGVVGSDAHYVGKAAAVVGDAISFFTFKTGASAYDWFAIPISGLWVAEA
jgi:hypothetical protein